MRTAVRLLLPLVIVVAAALGARAILSSAPEPERAAPPARLPSVEAITLVPTDYPVVIRSRGTVRPSLEMALVPEVVGSVARLSEDFVLGGRFEAGDTLVQLDERDYRIALTRARANLAQAEAQLAEQQALADTARADWDALGRRGEPSSLTLREPQRAAAEASRDAASAEVERAQLDLARTRIVAPWPGRVLAADVDAGQFVNRGTPIGRIHGVDSVEVVLPVSIRQLEFLDVSRRGTPVEVETETGTVRRTWTGRLVRAEGVEASTQQLGVVARIDDPYASEAAPLRIGRFVDARLQGEVLTDVFVIPRGSVRAGSEVLLLDEEGRVSRRPIEVAWSDEAVVAVRGGLVEGDVLVLTPLATVADGAPVRATIDGVPPSLDEAPGGGRGLRDEPVTGADAGADVTADPADDPAEDPAAEPAQSES